MNANPQSRVQTVKILANFWRFNEQFLIILLDKLIAYRILDNLTVLNWLFAEIIPAESYGLLAWEVLDNILAKITGRTQQIQSRATKEETEHKRREEERFREKKFHTNGSELSEKEKSMEIERQTEVERIKALNNNLNYALQEEKEIFILVFRLFIEILTRRLSSTLLDDDPWFHWTLGHFREFGLKHHIQLSQLIVTLETLLFSTELDPRILSVFQELRSVDCI